VVRKRVVLAVVTALAVAVAVAVVVGGASGASGARTLSLAQVAGKCPAPYLKQAKTPVDTVKVKKAPPWTIGASGSTLTYNSYIVYMNQELKYGVSRDKRIAKLIETDAGYNASKQVSDIQSLIRQKVDVLLVWPTDDKAIAPAIKKASAAGIPVVQVTNGFVGAQDINAYATVDLWTYYVTSATHLFNDLGGKGKIAQVLTLPGTTEDTIQRKAVDCVLKLYPKIQLVDSQYGKYATPDTRTVVDAWVQRFPDLNGILSVYGEPSVGAAQSLQQAGRLSQVKISPGNQSNGWLKFLAQHPEQNAGGVSYPVTLGRTAVEVAAKLLSGQPLPWATFVGGGYVSKQEMVKLAKPDKPDSWWPNDLPPKFAPK
jgi:ribose transport system substrate-binding protein